MKFKLDENLPELVRDALRELGCDAHTVAQEQLSGAQDATVLQACIVEGRVLITLDLDFADIRAYPPGTHPGIWVLRPSRQTFRVLAELVQAGIRLAGSEKFEGQLWVIDEKRVRIRSDT